MFHNLNKSSFSALRLTLPEPGQISAYGAFAKPIFDAMLAPDRESAKLATLSDYLLPRLLSGRVRVEAVECR